MSNKTSESVEKWLIPLYWDHQDATEEQIDFSQVACIPKDQTRAIMEKYRKMEAAMGIMLNAITAAEKKGNLSPLVENRYHHLKDAYDFDPLSND